MTENRPNTVFSMTSKNIDAANHVTGRSLFVDDIPVRKGTLYAKVFGSPIAHGIIKNIDFSNAEKADGVVKIITATDIPGENQIGGIIPDEPLLAEKEVHFQGQPILIIVAKSEHAAEDALPLISVEINPLPIITDPQEAFKKGHFLHASRTFKIGNVDEAFKKCKYVFEGKADVNGQEHLYLETQGAYSYPLENENIKINSSTQGPTALQRTAAKVLGFPMHKIEVDVTRLGGGFGGKEDQATSWGVMVALASHLLKRPVKYVLHRMEDMRITGKRHPYSADFKIGLDKNYKILAYEATFYQNGGAAADLSPAVMERTLFHATNSYFAPNVKVTAHGCKTNLPPNTAFRGFGGPQGMFVIESAIDQAAKELDIDAHQIQQANLLQDGDEFPYGQIVQDSEAVNCWNEVSRKYNLEKIKSDISDFNENNPSLKKGMAMMPVCFGISFTNTMMNNARALVHVYSDGSVGVSTGAVEMGQGVNTKMLQVAAKIFGIDQNRIKIETTNTTRVANTSPSAASSTADLNGKALADACCQILNRLKKTAKQNLRLSDSASIEIINERIVADGNQTGLNWEQLIQVAFTTRVNLSAKGHYATPIIHFDKTKEKGHPFSYYTYGTAIIISIIDCIRGIYEIESVHVVHDFGTSMNRDIDLGQTEGGIVQGIGWMTMEELLYNDEGRLLSNALSTYKVPDIYSVPKEINVHFLNTDGPEDAIFKSKAVGEPPLMYGIGAYFSLRNAILAYNPNAVIPYDAPMTPEKVLMALYDKSES